MDTSYFAMAFFMAFFFAMLFLYVSFRALTALERIADALAGKKSSLGALERIAITLQAMDGREYRRETAEIVSTIKSS